MKFSSALIILAASGASVTTAKDLEERADKRFLRKDDELTCTEDEDAPDCCLIPTQGFAGISGKDQDQVPPAPIAGKFIGRGKTGTPGGCAEVCVPLCSEGEDNAGGTPKPTCVTPSPVAEDVDFCALLQEIFCDEDPEPSAEGKVAAYVSVSRMCPEDLFGFLIDCEILPLPC